ncbi:ABC transporter ATP-binding protein [Armatimonas sp.]|uniref:ABC transporter ATP-binding protein n=1 Tax=Armatimonas sp. TaxID=1872638 RepID=UPI00286CBF18|nr:ABC transporter ATP-binding protein [Armatimonas sp.]
MEARALTRRFGSFTALDSVDFDLRAGEIHAVLGENGAGKSTLMNVLSGLLRPSAGELLLEGSPTRFDSPADASAQGIGMVHQHFLLVPPLSVTENLLLSANKAKGGPLSWPITDVLDEAKVLAEKLGWSLPWDALAGSLPVGTQQRIEILKALRGETKILIFDEPTAVLTPTETPELFATLRQLAAEGKGIVFISHKLDEVLALSERVTVLRRGKVVARLKTAECDAGVLAEAMVGRDVIAPSPRLVPRLPSSPDAPSSREEGQPNPLPNEARVAGEEGRRLSGGEMALTVQNVTLRKLKNISFTVAPGEILGFAGVDGNGQTELADCLSGMSKPQSGEILVAGAALQPSPKALQDARIGVIPADRQKRGLALSMTITENLTLGVQDSPAFRRGPFLSAKALRARAEQLIQRFDIRAEGPDSAASSLSGGNQQKVVIARALAGEPKVVVAVNPTRGLDVGAIGYVHKALREAQASGAAILLISTELDEVLTLSDRVAVLFDGRLMGIVSPQTPREELGRLMGGAA